MGTLILTLAAFVQAAGAYPTDIDCTSFGDGSPVAMNECLYGQSEEWDRRLNSEYKAAMRRVGMNRAKLRSSQRAWLRYRDANCEVYFAIKGSDGKLLANICERDMTRARTIELSNMVWVG